MPNCLVLVPNASSFDPLPAKLCLVRPPKSLFCESIKWMDTISTFFYRQNQKNLLCELENRSRWFGCPINDIDFVIPNSVLLRSANDSDRPMLISDSMDASNRINYNLIKEYYTSQPVKSTQNLMDLVSTPTNRKKNFFFSFFLIKILA